MGSKLDQAVPYGMLAKERKETIEKNRQRHIWMGRDNEFKKSAANTQSVDSRINPQLASKTNSDLKEKLRAHNFNFGYTDKKELERARVKSI